MLKEISGIEVLYAAHKKARLGKRFKPEVIRFEMDLALNLWTLKKELDMGQYCGCGYREFKIFEPKERLIQAAAYRDRVVQHAICDNVVTPYVAAHVVRDNAACQIGKGTHFALVRLSKHLRDYFREYGSEGYVLKADIRKYFPSIDHEVLRNQWARSRLDGGIKELLFRIIDSYATPADNPDIPGDGRPRGLPMGNQTSQQFAVFYLDPLDRMIKERWGIKYYSRYMDDMIVIHPDREFLKCLLVAMEEKAAELRLEFNRKTQITPLKNGIDYLGWHFYLSPNGAVRRRLRTQAKKRIIRNLKKLRHDYGRGAVGLEKVGRVMASYKGHLIHGNTHGFRKSHFSRLNFVRD